MGGGPRRRLHREAPKRPCVARRDRGASARPPFPCRAGRAGGAHRQVKGRRAVLMFLQASLPRTAAACESDHLPATPSTHGLRRALRAAESRWVECLAQGGAARAIDAAAGTAERFITPRDQFSSSRDASAVRKREPALGIPDGAQGSVSPGANLDRTPPAPGPLPQAYQRP